MVALPQIQTPAFDATTVLAEAAPRMSGSLGLAFGKMWPPVPGIPRDKTGAFVALLGESSSLQVAILSDEPGIGKLARALMSMEPHEEDLDAEDVMDCIGEIANQLAGLAKRILTAEYGDLRIGLPLMVNGSVRTPRGVTSSTLRSRWGDVDVWLVIVVPDRV